MENILSNNPDWVQVRLPDAGIHVVDRRELSEYVRNQAIISAVNNHTPGHIDEGTGQSCEVAIAEFMAHVDGFEI